MSSDSSVPRPDNLNYKAVHMSNGRYRMRKIPLNNTQLPIAQNATSLQLLEFKLPANQVFNTSRTTIDYMLTIGVPTNGALTANWTFEDTFCECASIQFCNASGVYFTDLQNANNYVAVARKVDMDQSDFEGGDYTSGLYKAVSSAANYFPPTATLPAANVYYAASGVTSTALTSVEPQYARPGVANSATTVFRSIPLSCFTGTAIGMDRDYIFAEDTYIRIMLAPSWRTGFAGTSVTSPAFNAILSSVSITNMYMQLAVQVDPDIVQAVQERFASGEMKYVIPYVYGWKSGTSTAGIQSVQISLNNQFGNRLKRMLYAPFNGAESGVTAYDHQNLNGAKISSYQTYLDSQPLQDAVLSCLQPVAGGASGMDDWRENRALVRGSALENSAAYYYNWFHCDSFSNPKRGKVLTPTENILEGLDLSHPRQWTITLTANTASLFHYVWGTFIRQVHATPQGTFVTVQ